MAEQYSISVDTDSLGVEAIMDMVPVWLGFEFDERHGRLYITGSSDALDRFCTQLDADGIDWE